MSLCMYKSKYQYKYMCTYKYKCSYTLSMHAGTTMSPDMNTYVYIYISLSTHICIYMFCKYVDAKIHLHIDTNVIINRSVRIHIHMYIQTTYIHTHIHVYIYMYLIRCLQVLGFTSCWSEGVQASWFKLELDLQVYDTRIWSFSRFPYKCSCASIPAKGSEAGTTSPEPYKQL